MNWIDLIIVIVIIIAIIRGFTDGLIKEVTALAALILGIWGAVRFSSFTAGKLYEWFDMTGQFVGIMAFLITFGVIMIIIHFIGIIVDKIMDAVSLGFVNRLLGMLFGFLKSVLIMSVIFVILNAIDGIKSFLPKQTIANSRFYIPIADVAPMIFPVLGEGSYKRSFDRFKKTPDERSEPERNPAELSV
ncbi:MAG: CvpA family protein [Bacteroidales bacterium]|nr:CvpA family protein [Bacteroidales bacterium]